MLCQELGVLPFAGALYDQPNSVVMYFRIIRAAMAEAESQEAKKASSTT